MPRETRIVAVTRLAWACACASVSLVLLAGCGRRATREDCQLIVNKSVELQLKALSQTSPEEIAKREAQVRSELDGQIGECEGRRVTDKMMACVQAARSAEELETCLR